MLLLLLCAVMVSKGQTQPYGQIDISDLKLTTCDFEKDANAVVLFDKTEVIAISDVTTITRHRRVKILNDKALNQADVVIEYTSKDHFEKITDMQAQTLYLDNGVIKAIPVDKALIYKQISDKATKTLKFSFPAVRPGAVIEYTYTRTIDFPGAVPNWNFQENLPVRYSTFDLKISTGFGYKIIPRVYSEYDKNVKEAIRGSLGDSTGAHYFWAVKNTESFRDEPYTTIPEDNIQNTRFFLLQTPYADMKLWPTPHTWPLVVDLLLRDDNLTEDLKRNLKDDYNILPAVKLLNTDEEKIRLIFNMIKNNVKWNKRYHWITYDVKSAWQKKEGHSAEINLMLYDFLRMAGIKCNLVYVSTRSHGRVDVDLPNMNNFNTMVLGVSTSAKKNYILDATSRFNTYDSVPFKLLNCYSLTLNLDTKKYDLKLLKDENPIKKAVFINAQIKPDGKLEGTAHISSFGCIKTEKLQDYADMGEIKYKEKFGSGDNSLKILSLQRENMDADSLPLIESADFQLDLNSSDERYIYVTPTLFTSFNKNPFLSEKRLADIDFGIQGSYSIKGLYKVPAGYKIDALPQGVSMAMPDKSITFKRVVSEQDGQILIRFNIDFGRSLFSVDEYPGIRDFYKKMFEMLNEQIVLKKN